MTIPDNSTASSLPSVNPNGVNGVTDEPNVFKMGNFCMDDVRPMKVVVIGAGYSGIIAGIRFLQKVKNIDLTIYDANAGVGGTWFVNRYPGLACDIPSHCYQLSFSENPNWSKFYSNGPEILAYLESVVGKYQLMPFIKLQHRLTCAKYNEDTGKWHLTIRRPVDPDSSSHDDKSQGRDMDSNYEVFEDTADVLFTGVGGLSRWSWPDIEELETFQGKVIHSAQWETGEGRMHSKTKWEDTVKDWGDKKVGVIGVGSSAIQIVPSLQPKVAQLVNYVRGKTWISVSFVRDHLANFTGDIDAGNYTFTDADKAKFQNPEYYKKFRRELESDLNAAHAATLHGNPLEAEGRKVFKEIMKQKLAKKPWIADYIIPDFAVACRRLTPGPGYLEALCEDNVEFVPETIKRVTPTGIETVDGKHRDLDIIVCATGFDTSYDLRFPFIGRGGVDLEDKYNPHPRTYLSVAVDGFPNWFCSLGPNSGVGAGSLLIILERQVDYAVAATLKLQRERLKSMEVKKEAVDDFDAYLESYFPTSVFGQKCRSWYKMGKEEGRVVALWPGSVLHCVQALAHPRWEDFNYEPLDTAVNNNRFYWLGNGNTKADTTPGSDKAWYLASEVVDVPPVPL